MILKRWKWLINKIIDLLEKWWESVPRGTNDGNDAGNIAGTETGDRVNR
jgi:hypothetical protein